MSPSKLRTRALENSGCPDHLQPDARERRSESMKTKTRLKLSVINTIQKTRSLLSEATPKEAGYALSLYNGAASLGINLPPLFPFGGAANYSLLYTIFRCVTELNVQNVLELGVGQSSLLLHAVSQKLSNLSVTSLEHDASWADLIRQRVSHEVQHAPLVSSEVHRVSTQVYDHKLATRFDMVVVDGPVGTKRNSRWGALEILDSHLNDEFVVIFDDASRPGEIDTIKEFTARSDVKVAFIHSAKSQCIVCTPAFHAAVYF